MNLSIGASFAAHAIAVDLHVAEPKLSQVEAPVAQDRPAATNPFDRLGNFEIQRLMSQFNQAETLSSNVQKKLDDTHSGQQQKIG